MAGYKVRVKNKGIELTGKSDLRNCSGVIIRFLFIINLVAVCQLLFLQLLRMTNI